MRKTEVAVQSNKLIALDRYDWTLQEQKIFLLLVASVDSMNDTDFGKITFTVEHFAKLIGVAPKGSIYVELDKITKKMLQRIFQIETENSVIRFQAISKTHYHKKEGMVTLTIHQDMKPFLLELNKNFTKIEIKNIAKMKSSHALRLYEILKMYGELKSISFQLDDLRKKLGIKPTELTNFADFNRYVLKIAEREINAKTDVQMTYEAIKTGRKVTQINFKINAPKSLQSIPHIQEKPTEQDNGGKIYGTQKFHDIMEASIARKKQIKDKEKLEKIKRIDTVLSDSEVISQSDTVLSEKAQTKPDFLDTEVINKTTDKQLNKTEIIEKAKSIKIQAQKKSFLKKLISILGY